MAKFICDFPLVLLFIPFKTFSIPFLNQFLQIAELKLMKGVEENNLFEVISINDETIYGGKVWISFDVHDNNSKVLSMTLDQSSCGMTCRYWSSYYNFNSGNGDLIQLKDLFTQKGFEKFFAYATKSRIAHLRKEIQKLDLSDSRLLEAISDSYKNDDLTDFYIKNNSLFIDGENSFHKNDKFYGIETVTKFRLSEFKPYLNNYGKSLFGLRKTSVKKYRSEVLPQLFYGKVGNSKVILVLNTGYEDEMRAEYVYTKYGKGIYLDGKIYGDKISFTEKIPKPNERGFIDYFDNGTIEAKFDGKTIVGKWISKDKKKTYNLKLKRK